jgi:uncharacterized protein YlxP (DUF503 family)
VAVAEIDEQEMWQRAVIAAVTVSGDRRSAEESLQRVEEDASGLLGPMIVRTETEWL